jgi:hypothetical protein
MSNGITRISLDIEGTGPAAGLNSMISLGAAAFGEHGEELGTWTANFKELPGAARDPDTMAWWATRQEAWAAATANAQDPAQATKDFVAWVQALPGSKKVAGAWPASYDYAYVSYYCWAFTGGNPLGHACLDIKSLAMGALRKGGKKSEREKQIEAMLEVANGDEHVAVADALRQGRAWMMVLREMGELDAPVEEVDSVAAL